jgi:hypothetical protein
LDGLARAVGAGFMMELPVLVSTQEPVLDEATGRQMVDQRTGEKVFRRVYSGVMGQSTEDGQAVNTWQRKTYRVSPIRIGDLTEIENHLLAEREPVEDVLPRLLAKLGNMPNQQEMMVRVALNDARKKDKVTGRDVAEYIDTKEGKLYTLWVCVREHQPEVDGLDAARKLWDLMAEDDIREFVKRRNIAGGTDLLGNSTGRGEPTPTSPASPASTSPNGRGETSPGGGPSERSPTPTDSTST